MLAQRLPQSPRRERLVPQWNHAYWVAIFVAALGAFAPGLLVLD
ncbi:hypothetical protein [Paraburkholderia tagetis]|nr:hypothetical protein [Paraburkholderia tagetis]